MDERTCASIVSESSYGRAKYVPCGISNLSINYNTLPTEAMCVFLHCGIEADSVDTLDQSRQVGVMSGRAVRAFPLQSRLLYLYLHLQLIHSGFGR